MVRLGDPDRDWPVIVSMLIVTLRYWLSVFDNIKSYMGLRKNALNNRNMTCDTKHDPSKGGPTISPSPPEIPININRRERFQNRAIMFPYVESTNTSD